MGTYDPKKLNDVEKLEIIKSCVVREVGGEKGRHVKPGDIVTMKGVEKAELLVRDLAVLATDKKKKEG